MGKTNVNSANSNEYKMSLYLLVCCLVVISTSSLQMGYQISMLNMPHESLNLLIQNKTFLFKVYFDGLAKYEEGLSWYNGNKTMLEDSQIQLENSKSRFLECTFTFDYDCQNEILENKKVKEREIYLKYGKNMTVEEALDMGREKLAEATVKLADGLKQLKEGEQKVIRVSKLIYLFFNCTLFIGAFIGAIVAKMVLKSRKKALLIHYIFCLVASILGFIGYASKSPMLLLAARLIFGLHVGSASVLVPIYLSEISPKNSRGSVVSLHYLGISVGLMIGQLISSPNVLGNQDQAYLLFGLPVLPSFLGLLSSLLFLTDTPHNFLFKNDLVTAKNMLERLRSNTDVGVEISEIQDDNNPLYFDQSIADIKMSTRSPVSVRSNDTGVVATPVTSFIQFLKLKYMLALFFVCFLINIAQQVGGFFYIFFYSSHMFKRLFKPEENRNICMLTLITSLAHLLGSLLGTILIDRIGRKKLFFYPCLLTLSSLLMIAISFAFDFASTPDLVFACIVLNVFSIGLGAGSTALTYTAESFRLNVKSTAVSYVMFFYWLVGLIFCFFYSILEIRNQTNPLIIFLIFLATFSMPISIFAILWKKIPETKGKTVLQILDGFQESSKRDENESQGLMNKA